MKNSRLFKAICLAISIIFILSSVPFSAAAADQPSIGVSDLSPEAFHRIVSQSVNKLPDEIYSKLSLCDEDLPEAMAGSGIEETEAVVRLKGQEKELSSLLYANADGTYTEYFFTENVKFDKDGEVKDKSNKLTYSVRLGGFTNEENDINVILPSVYPSKNGVSLAYAENVISFKAEECALSEAEYIKGENGADKIVYKDVFAPGIDLEYFAQFSGVKENIILNDKPQNNVFTFRIKTNGAHLQNQNGSVMIFNEKNEYIGYIGELYIYDAEGKAGTGSVQIEEITAGDEYLYTLTVDNEYLNNTDTVYPVTVDPQYTYDSGESYYDSLLIYIPPFSYYLIPDAVQAVLGNQISYTERILATFPEAVSRIKTFESSDMIISAKYTLHNTATLPSGNTCVSCYRMTFGWSVTGTSGVYLWDAYAPSTLLEDYFTSEKDTVVFELADYFKYWYDANHPNYGLMIKMTNENSTSCTVPMKETTLESKKPNLVLRYSMAPLPNNPATGYINDKSICKLYNVGSSLNMLCNRFGTNYSLSVTDTPPAPGSTLDSSQFFSVHSVSGTGYYKISPTNRNYRGSSELYGAGTEYFLSCTENSVTLSDVENDYTYWYFVCTNASFYIINKYYNYRCLMVISPSIFNCEYDSSYSKWYILHVGLDVPLIKQLPNYCGPCSILQILVYLNEDSLINNYSNYTCPSNYTGLPIYAKYQKAIGSITGTTIDDSHATATSYNRVVKFFNPNDTNGNTYGINHSYAYYGHNDLTSPDDIYDYINNSLNNNLPVILHARTDKLNYSTEHEWGHFICLVGYAGNFNNIDYYIVRDCDNYDDYFGEFIITGNEILNMLPCTFNGAYRHVICLNYN